MNTTYIIPVRIESPDRARNLTASLRYLLKNTDGKIIIKEVDTEQRVPKIVMQEITNSRVCYLYENDGGPFHRTRYLNDMLDMVTTDVVCNYDADVILPPEAYAYSEAHIIGDYFDAVYPYPASDDGQVRLYFDDISCEKFLNSSDLRDLHGCSMQLWKTYAGHCFFIKKDSYKRVGGENENFISWGPEDSERILRFEKLGLKIGRLSSQVIHMEHVRGPDSGYNNPHCRNNDLLFAEVSSYSREQYEKYLNGQDYVKTRRWVIGERN